MCANAQKAEHLKQLVAEIREWMAARRRDKAEKAEAEAASEAAA